MTAPQQIAPDTEPSSPPVFKGQWTRRRLLRFMGGGFLALVAGGSLRTWRVLQPPVVVFPSVILPSPNAYDVYVRAINKMVRVEEIFKAPLSSAPLSENSLLCLHDKQFLLQVNDAALCTFREGLPLAYHEPPLRNGDALFDQLRPFRTMAKLLVLEADVYFQKGDLLRGVHSCLDAVQLGQAIPRGGPFLTRLVGIACQAIGRRQLWHQMDGLSADAAKAGAQRLEKIIGWHVPLSETWAEEKYFCQAVRLKTLQNADRMAHVLFGENQSDDAPTAPLWQKAQVYGMCALWSKTRLMDNLSIYMDDRKQISGLPYARRSAVSLPPDALNRCSLGRALYIFDAAELKDVNSSQTQNALLCAALALQSFRAEHGGTYPAALDDLVTGGYLSRVPVDPFSPSGTAPLHYRKLPNGGKLLWSVGPDGKNDNGTPITDPAQTGNARYFVTAESRGDLVAGTNIF